MTFLSALSGCSLLSQPPKGPDAFKAAQEAFRHVPQFSVTWTQTTPLGVFTETAAFDCTAGWYQYRYTKDLSPKGIADGATQIQGRPRAHQEEQRLFVDGASYYKFTGSWDQPSNGDDAHPAWTTSMQSYDPSESCQGFLAGKLAPFVPFENILTTNQIKFVETRDTGSGSCNLYEAAYWTVGDSDTMTSFSAGGSTGAFRQEVRKLGRSTVCLDQSDSLPRQGSSGETVFTYSYDPLPKPSAPVGSWPVR